MLKAFFSHLMLGLRGAFSGSRTLYRYEGGDRVSVVAVTERGPLVVVAAVLVLGLVVPARVWLVVGIGFVLTIAFCVWWAVQLARNITLERRLRFTWIQVGDRLEEEFILHNECPFPALAAELEDHSDVPGYNASSVYAIGGNQVEKWRLHASSQRRGVFHLGPTTMRFSDPLGLFQITTEYLARREVLVVPPVLRNLRLPIPAGGGQGQTTTRQRNLIETTIIGGIRGYHPGDPIRRVHWPLSMKHNNLQIKEFDDERGGDIWLTLDLDPSVHVGTEQKSTLEYAIIWAATWAWHLLRQGKGVGVYARSPERVILHPRKGSAHLWDILRALAILEARSPLPVDALLQEVRPILARAHSLIVFTPSTDPDWPVQLLTPGLQAAVRGVVLIDAPSFIPEPDRVNPGAVDAMRAMLAGIGVPVYPVHFEERLEAMPATPGTGDWDLIATPWGKVVARSTPAEAQR